MSDEKAPPHHILVPVDGAEVVSLANKETVLVPDTKGYIPGPAENSPPDPHFRWQGPRTDYPRNANAADQERRARFANGRENALAAPAPENTAMVLAHAQGIPLEVARRIVALEARVAELEKTVTALNKLFSRLVVVDDGR